MGRIFLLLVLSAVTVNAQYVLHFDGRLGQHVEHGQFFETSTPSAPVPLDRDFAWEGWVKIDPTLNHGYVISAGYGGGHAILAGFQRNGDLYSLVGNFWTAADAACSSGGGAFSFSTDPVFYPGIWYNFAVASRDHVLTIYKNGVPVWSQTWTGERFASVCNQNDPSGSGLYIGGSDHLNFTGAIAAIRGWEGYSPYAGTAFVPEISFRSDWLKDDGSRAYSALLADYTQRGSYIADISSGYRGKRHSGHLHAATNGLTPGRPTITGKPLPGWAEDPTFPLWSETEALEPVGAIPPPPAPIFDSFTRNEVNLSSGGGLGRTETGQAWTSNSAFGIQNERAVSLSTTYYGSALIDVGNQKHFVEVSRGSDQSETGVRVSSTDLDNGYAVFTGRTSLFIGRITNGTLTLISTTTLPPGWRKLRVEVDKTIRIFADQTVVASVGAGFSRGTKVGLYQYAPGIVQFDNFAAGPLGRTLNDL